MTLFVNMLVIFFIVASTNVSANATFDWRNNQLSQLEKMTVGPWDNFSTTLIASTSLQENNHIIYTQDKNQILSLFQLNVDTGESKKFSFSSSDIKQPALSNSGKILAFTYFGDDAQGDICLYRFVNNNLADADAMTCFNVPGAAQSAFWLGENKLGYLKREPDGFEWQLIVRDLITAKERLIAQGDISAPTASHDGRYILFNVRSKQAAVESIDEQSQMLHLFDMNTSFETMMSGLNLPGNIGFSAFSIANNFIYFSYYLNDTNNDQRIDADDNSVIFRLPFKRWKLWQSENAKILPEQLTSVDFNCKFPQPGHKYLYLTCAFGGSLDVYRLPLTGMVKPGWDKKQLNEAHEVARNYEQRLLLLNTVRYRDAVTTKNILQRIIGNHLQLGEIAATRYYINQFLSIDKEESSNSPVDQVAFYQMLNDLLVLRAEKRKYKNNVITIAFQHLAKKIKQEIEQNLYSISPVDQFLAHAFVENELDNTNAVLMYLNKTRLTQYKIELEKYLAISLYEEALTDTELLPYYFDLLNDGKSSFEFRLFYAFKFLALNGVYDLDAVSAGRIKSFFLVDDYLKRMINTDDEKEKINIYKALSKFIRSERDNEVLIKAMYLRAINVLAENNELRYMELLSRHWLTLTKIRAMSFYRVAKQYEEVNKDKAYGFLRNNALQKAFNSFYPVMRQTNDLESYYQYIAIGLDDSQQKNDLNHKLKKSLAVLKKQNILGENEKYIDALILLLNDGSQLKNGRDASDIKILDKALSLLQSRDKKSSPDSMNELLLGFIYHKKLQASKKAYVYDKQAYQQAHYHYMMALDLARDNVRVSATVLNNLGWLHHSVAQYALAVTYFQQRDIYPFLSNASELSFRWVLADSFYFNNQPEEAGKQMGLVLSKFGTKSSLPELSKESELPYKEKAAFYAMQAGNYAIAIERYQNLLSSSGLISDLNLTKIKLAYGFSLSKEGFIKDAMTQFYDVILLADKLKKLPANDQRLIAFNPLKQQLLAHGFIAKLSTQFVEIERHLKMRINILKQLKGRHDIDFDEASRLSFLAKDYQSLALLYEDQNELQKMRDAIDQSFDVALQWVEESGDDIGPVIYRTLINYLSLGISHSDIFHLSYHKRLKKTYINVTEALKTYPYPSSSIIYQHTKLIILWSAFNRVDKEVFDTLMRDKRVVSLIKASPKKYDELNQFVEYFNP